MSTAAMPTPLSPASRAGPLYNPPMNILMRLLAGPEYVPPHIQHQNPARATRRAQIRAMGRRQWRRWNLAAHALRMRDKRRAALAAIRVDLVA